MHQKSDISPSVFQDQSTCPYFTDGRISTIEFILPGDDTAGDFHKLLAEGYRRLGRVFYHNICENCTSCLPLRIETSKFKTSRGQRRVIKRNMDIKIQVLPSPHITPEKVMLYHRYVKAKHGENEDNNIETALNALMSFHYGYEGIIEMNYYLEDRLIGVGIVDEGKDALSSNYFYYDPDHLVRSPGTFSILQEIELAESLKKKYYYLGFYIKKNPKMSYKKSFRPNQIYKNGDWMNSK